jgi:PAS domain S-box-containing protein
VIAELSQAYLSFKQQLAVEQRIRLFVDSVQDYALLTLDPDGRIASWNTGAERLKGYRADEVLGKHFSIFYPPEERTGGKPELELDVAAREGRYEEDGWRVRKDGSRFWASVIITAMRDENGVLQGFGKVTRDFTERRQAEQERELLNRRLAVQNEELVRVSRAKTDFMAMMSHELRTPLNSIIGFSEVLIDQKFGALNERQARYVRNVNDSGRHLLNLINDLLDLSKIEAGRLDIVRQPCAPRALVVDAAATLQPLADQKGIRLELEPPSATQLVISADGARLKQVLYNLLSNAIKFTPAGGSVRVRYARSPVAGMARISVSDTGPGIAAEDAARLFSAFTQLENAKDQGGTGLGLALVKQLMELMGGSVGLETVVGEGSTFWVDVPLHDGAATAAAPKVESRSVSATAPLALIVEDEAGAQELLVLLLEAHGYRTTTAATAEEALEQARRLHPEVITLDVFLPTVDGWDVLRLLKTDPQTAEIPVVMVTVSNDRAKAFSLGAMEHLVKPVAREALLEALGRRGFTERAQTESVRVLAIDDDTRQLELYRVALEPRGFVVRTETNGPAGVEAARRERVDVILLDLVMPEMSGVEVVAQLRSDERTRAIPILLVTAHELSHEDRSRLGGDVQAIVSKGAMAISELPNEIGRVLRRRMG